MRWMWGETSSRPSLGLRFGVRSTQPIVAQRGRGTRRACLRPVASIARPMPKVIAVPGCGVRAAGGVPGVGRGWLTQPPSVISMLAPPAAKPNQVVDRTRQSGLIDQSVEVEDPVDHRIDWIRRGDRPHRNVE